MPLPKKTAQAELDHLRLMINELDDIIIQSVAKRMIVSRTIGAIKKDQKLSVKDPKREKILKNLHKKLAQKHQITYGTLQKIFALIIEESKRIQK